MVARKEKEKASVAAKLSRLPYKLLNCSRKVEGTRSKRIKRAFPFSYPLAMVWKKGKKGRSQRAGEQKEAVGQTDFFAADVFPR